jgi:hypothetical protein
LTVLTLGVGADRRMVLAAFKFTRLAGNRWSKQ